MEDCNADLLRFESHAKTCDFLEGNFSYGFRPVISNKSRLFPLKLYKPTEENILRYKWYNKLYNILTWTMKTLYYRTALDDNTNN